MTPGRDEDRERGSMIVAVTIILILTLVGSMIAARSVGAAFVSSGQQHVDAAVSEADAGLADAVYRLNQGSAGSGGGTAFCVRPGDDKCVAASVPAAPDVSYLATQVNATDWLVESIATVRGQTAAVEGHVTRQQAYPFALFGSGSLDLNGSPGPSFGTYTSTSPLTAGPPANPTPGGTTVGSNGTITCSGSLGTGMILAYYGGGGVSSTGSSACGTYRSSKDRFYLFDPQAPSGAGACPGTGVGGGEFGSAIAGAPTILAAGTYLCTVPVTIDGRLDVSGPVQLYVRLDPSTYGSGTAPVTIAPGSYVNDQADYCAASGGCDGSPDLPDSQSLEILTDDPGGIGVTAGGGFYLGAVLYAPNAYLAGDACSSHFYGTVVVDHLSCGARVGIDVSYDTGLADVYGPWAAGSYTQINPSTFETALTASGL